MSNVSVPSYTTYGAYKAGELIWKIVPPILILLGTAGNILSIVVLARKSIRTSTTALYLSVLAVSDLVVLYSGLLRQWLKFLFETDVRHVSAAGCKINIWFVYTSLDFSAWILIAVTLERVISAWFPHNARTTCTKKSASALMTSILVFLLLLNSHLLYGMEFKYDDDGKVIGELKCTEIDKDYVHFFNKVWPWIDLCVFCVVPFSVIIVGNSLILFKVIKSQKKAKSRIVPSINTENGHRQGQAHHSKQSSLTAMLFTLNIVFLFSTSPVSIYNIGYAHWAEKAEQNNDQRKFAELDLWWAVVNMFMYTTNSLNFLLYCLSGSKFRHEVLTIFCARKRNGMPTAVSNYTRTKFQQHVALQTLSSASDKKTDVQTKRELTDNKTVTNSNKHCETQGISTISGNTLHPDSALKINRIEVKESEHLSLQTVTSDA